MKFLKLAAVGAALVAASSVAQAGATFENVKRKALFSVAFLPVWLVFQLQIAKASGKV